MDNKQQLKRFKETAKQSEADTSDDALDRIMGKLDLKHRSDKEAEKPE